VQPAEPPRILILDRSQQGHFQWSDILTDEVLADVVQRVTGRDDFDSEWVEWDTETWYNAGRMAKITYLQRTTCVSFSPHGGIVARNSSIQSASSALTLSYLSNDLWRGWNPQQMEALRDALEDDFQPSDEICYYFLENHGQDHNIGYLRLMYRIMVTAGIRFLNPEAYISAANLPMVPFNSVDDLRRFRVENTENATAPNQPTYITMHPDRGLEVFVKTNGANKKAGVLLIHALSCVAPENLEVNIYTHDERDRSRLPAPDLRVIEELANVNVTNLDFAIERADDDDEQGDIRNQPLFIRNLLERFGVHRCMFCGEGNEILVQGAHIWDIWQIRLDNTINLEQSRIHANHGENGLWLCRTHHAQFDNPRRAPQLGIDAEGRILVHNEVTPEIVEKLRQQIESTSIPQEFVTDAFAEYVNRRYEYHIRAEDYQPLHENLE